MAEDKNIQNQANMMLNNLILAEQLPELIKSLELFAKATIMVTNWQNITFMQAKQSGG